MATSSNVINLSKPCPIIRFPITNITSVRFRSPKQHKQIAPFNFNANPQRVATTRTKTTSLARINGHEEVVVEEKSPPVIMSQSEQILQLTKSLAERPLEFAVDMIAPPGTSLSQSSLRFFLAAVAVVAVLPGGSWEWWIGKAVVCGGLLVSSAILLVLSAFFE